MSRLKSMIEPTYPLLSISRLRMETDGEGVTTLVAGAGCGLECRYCINKEILLTAPEPVTAAELYERVKIDDLYFQATGGGVTFGGGEALLHSDFIAAFHGLCADRWKLYAETALFVPPEAVVTAAKCIDSFIVDIKSMDPDVYRRYTGQDNRIVCENLRRLIDLVGPERVRIKIPRIPGFHTDEDRERSARIAREMGYTNIEFLDYTVK